MNWEALGAIAEAVGAAATVGALILGYYAYRNSPKLVERVREEIKDQQLLEQAEAQDEKAKGIREVILEHNVNDLTRIRNIAKINQDDRIVELRGSKGKDIWNVGDRVSPDSYKEINQTSEPFHGGYGGTMDSGMKKALEYAGKQLNLRNSAVYPPGQATTGWVLRWLNDDGKYEQVWVFQENFISRHEDVTPENVTKEVKRLIETGETEVVN